MCQKRLAYLTATWFYSGYAPKASGTVGSFLTLPVAWACIYFGGVWAVLAASALFMMIGTWATNIVLKDIRGKKSTHKKKDDPGFVVIDEVAGQLLTFAGVASFMQTHLNMWWLLIIGFGLFRFFDIVKIWPACYYDRNVHTGFGVMMDDVVAGVYAAVCMAVIIYFI